MDTIEEYLAAAGIVPAASGPMSEALQMQPMATVSLSKSTRQSQALARNRRLAYATLCLRGDIPDGYLSLSNIEKRYPGFFDSVGTGISIGTGGTGGLTHTVRQASMAGTHGAADSTPSFSDVLGKAAMRMMGASGSAGADQGMQRTASAEAVEVTEEDEGRMEEEEYSGPEATQALLAATTEDDPAAAREEALHLLVQRFIAGEEGLHVDYAMIDENEALDMVDLHLAMGAQGTAAGGASERDRDREESYFSNESPPCNYTAAGPDVQL